MLFLWSGIVVRELDPDLAGIAAFALKGMPSVRAASSSLNDAFQADPALPDELGLPVVIEDRNLELSVVRRIMYGEAKLLIPLCRLLSCRKMTLGRHQNGGTYHRGV